VALDRLVAGVKGEAVDAVAFELPDHPAPYRGRLGPSVSRARMRASSSDGALTSIIWSRNSRLPGSWRSWVHQSLASHRWYVSTAVPTTEQALLPVSQRHGGGRLRQRR
jgi:hypothetical protein